MSYYEQSRRLLADWRAALEKCGHADRAFTIEFGRELVRCCVDCSRKADPLYRAYNAQYKRDRKAQLDALPRCDIPECNRRATWDFPYGVKLCGIHKRNLLRAHARATAGAGILALLYPAHECAADLIRWANGDSNNGS